MAEEYGQVAELLSHCGIEASPAEVHGVVCGLVCSEPARIRDWGAAAGPLLGGDQGLPEAAQRLVAGYAERIDTEMSDGDFAFQPLLPTESVGLGSRIRALAHWCGGFCLGFAGGRAAKHDELAAETREVIEDFSRIARVDSVSDAGLQEQDEADFIEILEYVRMASTSLYLHHQRAPRADVPGDNQLH